MLVVNCKNNHYFDLDQHKFCPVCGCPAQPRPAVRRRSPVISKVPLQKMVSSEIGSLSKMDDFSQATSSPSVSHQVKTVVLPVQMGHCANNHYYNASLYSECPFCKKGASSQPCEDLPPLRPAKDE